MRIKHSFQHVFKALLRQNLPEQNDRRESGERYSCGLALSFLACRQNQLLCASKAAQVRGSTCSFCREVFCSKPCSSGIRRIVWCMLSLFVPCRENRNFSGTFPTFLFHQSVLLGCCHGLSITFVSSDLGTNTRPLNLLKSSSSILISGHSSEVVVVSLISSSRFPPQVSILIIRICMFRSGCNDPSFSSNICVTLSIGVSGLKSGYLERASATFHLMFSILKS